MRTLLTRRDIWFLLEPRAPEAGWYKMEGIETTENQKGEGTRETMQVLSLSSSVPLYFLLFPLLLFLTCLPLQKYACDYLALRGFISFLTPIFVGGSCRVKALVRYSACADSNPRATKIGGLSLRHQKRRYRILKAEPSNNCCRQGGVKAFPNEFFFVLQVVKTAHHWHNNMPGITQQFPY